MKAVEFISELKKDQILVPMSAAKQLPKKEKVKVIVYFQENDDDEKDWDRFTAQEFLKGYSDEDAIYDNFPL